jgi:hypothetical protein
VSSVTWISEEDIVLADGSMGHAPFSHLSISIARFPSCRPANRRRRNNEVLEQCGNVATLRWPLVSSADVSKATVSTTEEPFHIFIYFFLPDFFF